ncbi:hypothetical protein BTN50_1673 (plasmid) [Candidatus Enterovibrio altilux]|uniref:Uncharacterized protein n=1 Tax=Candidatus Enterovibrio altilux TaxID=1927128 RepID=A0A291BAR6_9GAMM|nr:hypothetical protein BTN50_1673 [Candidatus Enterovibrio luxaltus]
MGGFQSYSYLAMSDSSHGQNIFLMPLRGLHRFNNLIF